MAELTDSFNLLHAKWVKLEQRRNEVEKGQGIAERNYYQKDLCLYSERLVVELEITNPSECARLKGEGTYPDLHSSKELREAIDNRWVELESVQRSEWITKKLAQYMCPSAPADFKKRQLPNETDTPSTIETADQPRTPGSQAPDSLKSILKQDRRFEFYGSDTDPCSDLDYSCVCKQCYKHRQSMGGAFCYTQKIREEVMSLGHRQWAGGAEATNGLGMLY